MIRIKTVFTLLFLVFIYIGLYIKVDGGGITLDQTTEIFGPQ
jgi:hypothetical protein